MGKLTVNDIPVTGSFSVRTSTGHVLHSFDDAPGEAGDISPDVAVLPVVRIYAKGDRMIIEV